jgi:pilus assembly protein Flp/PilA
MPTALTRLLARVTQRDRGATATEYALLVDLIAAVIVAVVPALSAPIRSAVEAVSGQLPTPTPP